MGEKERECLDCEWSAEKEVSLSRSNNEVLGLVFNYQERSSEKNNDKNLLERITVHKR